METVKVALYDSYTSSAFATYVEKLNLNNFNNEIVQFETGQLKSKAAKVAREQIEKSSGKKVVSKLNAKNLGQIQLPDGEYDDK
jgi:hypothetical protein